MVSLITSGRRLYVEQHDAFESPDKSGWVRDISKFASRRRQGLERTRREKQRGIRGRG